MTKHTNKPPEPQGAEAPEEEKPLGYSSADFAADEPLGDTSTSNAILTVPLHKPHDQWFMVNPDPAFKRAFYMLDCGKDEGWHFVHASLKAMLLEEKKFHRCMLHTWTYFDGEGVGLWPIVQANADGERHESYVSQDEAARRAQEEWIKIRWTGKQWKARAASGDSYKALADWQEILGETTFDDLFELASRKRLIVDPDNLLIKKILGTD